MEELEGEERWGEVKEWGGVEGWEEVVEGWGGVEGDE